MFSFWNKEKKQSYNKQRRIGKLDPATGELIPNKSRGDTLSHFPEWAKTHKNPFGSMLTTQRISELLADLDEDGRQTFLAAWLRYRSESEYLCFDITSVSSYSALNEHVKYGYNRDGEDLPQINLALLFGQKSMLPVYYRELPGNISDVRTLRNLLDTFAKLGMPKVPLVMDRGFYSTTNVDDLLAGGHKFEIGVPMHCKWLRDLVDQQRDDMQLPQNMRWAGGEMVYAVTCHHAWGEEHKRCTVHLYYNHQTVGDTISDFNSKLLTSQRELESGELVPEHEEFYQQYFTVRETPKRGRRVTVNVEAVKEHQNRYCGYYAILTNDVKDPVLALRIYRDKDVVEKCVGSLKNQLDMKRLRTHGRFSTDGRLLVQFITVTLMSALRNKMRELKLDEKFTVRQLLADLETLSEIGFSGRYGKLLTETTKAQRAMMEGLGVPAETWLQN